jgi:hypothetical protein
MAQTRKPVDGRHPRPSWSLALAVIFLVVLGSTFLWLISKPLFVDLTTYEKTSATEQIELVRGPRGSRLLIRYADGSILGFSCDVWGRSRACLREAEAAGLRTGDIARVTYLRPPEGAYLEEPIPLLIQVGDQIYMNCSRRVVALDLVSHAGRVGLCH